jgi:hypothetical protein
MVVLAGSVAMAQSGDTTVRSASADPGSGAVDDSSAAARQAALKDHRHNRKSATYPVKRSRSGRYLTDAVGHPYLIAGDAPQSLFVNLLEPEAELYFANREQHAFNAAWINILCADYTGGRADGSTLDGILPFTTAGDLATPNEAYFTRVDHMLEIAAMHGINVFLNPAETGSFLSVLVENGVDKSRKWGQYLGRRYKRFDNIVWMSGNDHQDWRVAAKDEVVVAVARGIQDEDTRHIHTVELDYPTSTSSDDRNFRSLIQLEAAYTYFPTYAQVLTSYNRKRFPVFMVEAVYDFESNFQTKDCTPHTLRRQEYWTNLSGATGQFYGNHYTWTFAEGWQDKLDTKGAAQMAYVKALFEPRAWYELIPDQTHTVLTDGYGSFSTSGNVDDNDYVTAARTPDGALIVAYLPEDTTVQLDMTQLRGRAMARWFDPSSGQYSPIAGSPFRNSGSRAFTPPGPNADGDPDWVLVVEAPQADER